jgi:DNA polymerase III subunit epsilon
MKFAITDIETTGMGIQGNKITEIAIFIHDGKKVVDTYHTLINPECNIPFAINQLTGINNTMVAKAPKFFEIAKKVIEITRDCIFVAHNVNFDYNIIHKEFSELGYPFKRKKLCTIRLSRKLIPGLPSYSLSKLCASQGIIINDRHRATGDAEATTILFEKLLRLDNNKVFESFLKTRSRQGTLPPLLPKNIFDELPEQTGVYYFKDNKGDIIYVGKAINIKKRVLSHFYDKKNKEVALCQQTADITYEITGSELVALLLESAEIKHYFPLYNRAQRRTNESFGIFFYEDRSGIIHLTYNRLKMISKPLVKCYNIVECRLFLEQLCEKHNLCPKYCHLQTNVSSCFHYQIKKCKGICRDQESKEKYNSRVLQAVSNFNFDSKNFVLTEKGRNHKEKAFVLVEKGTYKGFGYMGKNKNFTTLNDYLSVTIEQKDNRDVQRIINSFRQKNENNVLEVC